MNCAAHRVSRKIGIVHGLGENSLACEGGVAVDQQRKIFFAATFSGAILLGASAAYGYGIDRFQMAGI